VSLPLVTRSNPKRRRCDKDKRWTHETFAPEPGAAAAPASAESTEVTWSFDGTNVFMLRVMSIFMNMDRSMGQHFEQGLQNLKNRGGAIIVRLRPRGEMRRGRRRCRDRRKSGWR
jgi:hypothetical protein